MKYRLYSILVLLFTVMGIMQGAKNDGKITGKIVDANNGESIAFATVTLYTKDSVLITGATTTENGTFTINHSVRGTHYIKTDYIGYKSAIKQVEINSATQDCGVITVEQDSEMLDAVVVTARVPVIEQKLDKLVMNVAEAVSTQGSDAVDILKKAPGVSVDMDGNIKLNGQIVSVWIDGRPSHLSGKDLEALLKATDGGTIDKIEIIAHPSSRYDAAGGGGIINIKTKKNPFQGFNGSISGAYGAINSDPYTDAYNASLNLNYRGEKTNSFLILSPRSEKMYADMSSWTLFGENNQFRQESDSDYLMQSNSNMLRLGTDYFINKKNIVGFIASGMLRNSKEGPYYGSETNTYSGGDLLNHQLSNIDNDSKFNNYAVNLNYTNVINEARGEEMTINLDYSRNDINRNSYQENISFGSEPTGLPILFDIFRSDAAQDIDIYSAKIDWERVVLKSGKLEAGLKYALTNTDNNTLWEDYINDQWQKNNDFSPVFKYSESISAAYASLAKMFGPKWVLKGGLRAEYTHSNGDWISANERSKKNYINLFPTLYVGYNPSQNWRYSLSYTRRVQRPNFSQLNPYRQYIDANSSLEGNPNLDPQFSTQLYASVGYGNHINLGVIFMHSSDLIMQTPLFDEISGEKKLSWDNFGTQIMSGAQLSITEFPITKWMIFNGNALVAYNSNKSLDKSFDNNGIMTSLYGNISFLLPKSWKIEVGGFRQGTVPWGYFEMEPMMMMFAGVKKDVFKNKGSLSLYFNDLFNTYNSSANVYEGGKHVYHLNQSFYQQSIRLSFNYRFGQSKASKRRNVGNLEESSRVGGSNAIGNTGTTTNTN